MSEEELGSSQPELPAEERFVRGALATVPDGVINEAVLAIAKQRVAAGQQVDPEQLTQQLNDRLASGSWGLEAPALAALAARIKENGFNETKPTFWDESPNTASLLGRVRLDAQTIVRDTVGELLS